MSSVALTVKNHVNPRDRGSVVTRVTPLYQWRCRLSPVFRARDWNHSKFQLHTQKPFDSSRLRQRSSFVLGEVGRKCAWLNKRWQMWWRICIDNEDNYRAQVARANNCCQVMPVRELVVSGVVWTRWPSQALAHTRRPSQTWTHTRSHRWRNCCRVCVL